MKTNKSASMEERVSCPKGPIYPQSEYLPFGLEDILTR